jgi:hypothetical protein
MPAMPHILEGALDSRLVRHPHNQAAVLGENTMAASPFVRVRPLPHDELPMPPQDRVRSHDRG